MPLPEFDPEKETPLEYSKRARGYLRDKAMEFVAEKWHPTGPPCPICGKGNWAVHEPVAMEPMGVPPFEGASFGACPISCDNCGYTVFLSLLEAGIIGQTADEREAST